MNFILVLSVLLADPALQFERVAPTLPEKAEATFRCQHDFKMQLLAAEPDVTDPVALEYDEYGRAWVVEMRDYPYTDKSTDRPNVERTTDLPLGRIRILNDLDGDGRFDRSQIFAEDLSWPTGLAFWKGGCFVTATPHLLYLKDTDGDGKADVREIVFTGFRKLNVQAVFNNPRWGLDHRIYAAGASNGGTITRPGDPSFRPIQFGRADFAFDPRLQGDGNEAFEILAGGARFGQTFDDWGNRFLCNIRNPLQHVVMENRYLSANPFLPVANTVHDVAEAGDTLPVYRISPPEPWRVIRAQKYRSEPGGLGLPRSELAAEGYFTSSSGITIYRGSAYPKEFLGNAFVGEVAGNLIHRQVLVADGVTFRSRPAEAMCEFIASTDRWFRAVNFTNAPDGTLHVCDMYRETIEHPWSISDELKGALDLESGRDRGRIYRIAPPGFVPPKHRKFPASMSASELVAELESPNSWWRDTAHRIIYERQDPACVEPLRALIRNCRLEQGRLHALWSLQGLNSLQEEDVIAGLSDAGSHVRKHAVRLAEAFFARSTPIVTLVLNLANDPAIEVRFQVACSLGSCQDKRVPAVLASILNSSANDSWTDAGALSSSLARSVDVLKLTDRERARFQLAAVTGAEGKREKVKELLSLIGRGSADSPMIAGLLEGLRRSGKNISVFDPDSKSLEELGRHFRQAAERAKDESTALNQRLDDIRLLGQGAYADSAPVLGQLISSRFPTEVQLEAVRTLGQFRDDGVVSILLRDYRALIPAVKGEVIEAMALRPERTERLIEAMEQGIIGVGDIPHVRRALLMRTKDPQLALRAMKLFEQGVSTGKVQVIADYRASLTLASEATRGQVVFVRECKNCHRLRNEGVDVGPNLATIHHRTTEELLTHILDPSREVGPNFVEYIVTLNDGRVVTGLIADETATAITLKRAGNIQETLLRKNIEEMVSSGKSLMPEGLELKITKQEMADLLNFLTSSRR